MALSYKILVKLLGDLDWTDITADVVGNDGFSASRGIRGNRPIDCVAAIGTFQFSLDDTAQNSGGVAGYYTIGHPAARGGWTYGIQVRLVFVLDGTEYVRWTGKIRDVLPEPGEARGLRALVVAHDYMSEIADNEIQAVAPQVDVDEVSLIEAMFDSLPATAQPTALVLDPPVTSFPYAFHDLGSGTKGLTVLEKVLRNARGFGWPLADGSFHYESAESRVLRASQYHFNGTMAGLKVPSGLDGVFNRFRLTTTQKPTDPSPVALWMNDGAILVEAGGTAEFFVTYRNPDNNDDLIGGVEFELDPGDVLPAGDYVGAQNEDGTGADYTADLSITVEAFASSAMFTIENTSGAHAVYLPAETLRLRGRGVYQGATITRQAYTAQPYGVRTMPIELEYRADGSQVQADADYLEANYRSRVRLLTQLDYIAQDYADFEEEACVREIGEAVKATEPRSGVNGVASFVQSIDYVLSGEGVLMVSYGLAPRIIEDAMTDETVYVHDRLYTAPVAPEDAIGFMRIGFSEIG